MAGAKERTFGYVITADDQASKVFKQVQESVAAGGATITEAMGAATQASDNFGKSQNALTNFVREERTEHRLQNFLFKEGRDVIGASALALSMFGMAGDSASAKTKMLTESLTQGFMTFQGLSFALSALGAGPFGVAAAALGGIAAMFYKLKTATSDATDKIADQAKVIDEILKKYEAWASKLSGTEEANRKVSEAEKELLKARLDVVNQVIAAQKEGKTQLDIIVDTSKKSAGELAAIQNQIQESSGQTLAENEKIALDLQKQLRAVSAAAVEVTVTMGGLKVPDSFVAGLQYVGLTVEDVARSIGRSLPKALSDAEKSAVHAMHLMRDSARQLQSEAEAAFQDYAQVMTEVYGGLTTVVGTLWTDVFSDTEAVGKKFLKNILLMTIDVVQGLILAAAAAYWAKGVISFGFSFVTDTPMLIAATVGLQMLRAFVNKMHDGGVVPKRGSTFFGGSPSDEYPILVRGGETVRTESQEAALGSGATVNMYFNAPVSDVEFVVNSVKKAIRQTGLTVDKLLVDNTSSIVLAR